MADQGTVAARLDHVGLAVADLAAAVAWFCDVFGLVPELTLRVDAVNLSIEMLIHPAYGYRLELLHRPGSAAGGKPGTPAEAGAGARLVVPGVGRVRAFRLSWRPGRSRHRSSRHRRAGGGRG